MRPIITKARGLVARGIRLVLPALVLVLGALPRPAQAVEVGVLYELWCASGIASEWFIDSSGKIIIGIATDTSAFVVAPDNPIYPDILTRLTTDPIAVQLPSPPGGVVGGIGGGGVATIGASVTAIVLSGWMIYEDLALNDARNQALIGMQNPPANLPGYNPSVPLDQYDLFYHLSNYWDFFLGGVFAN